MSISLWGKELVLEEKKEFIPYLALTAKMSYSFIKAEDWRQCFKFNKLLCSLLTFHGKWIKVSILTTSADCDIHSNGVRALFFLDLAEVGDSSKVHVLTTSGGLAVK